MAEMALLATIYAAIMTAVIYLAQIGLVKTGAQRMVGYAAAQVGEQGLPDVETMMPGLRSMSITDFKDDIDPADMWSGDDISQTLEEMARAPVGHYVYKDGKITYVLDADRLSAYGKYIFENDLQNESGAVAEVLAGWMYRTSATTSAQYRPMFGDWDPVDIENVTSHSLVRGERQRGTHPGHEPDFSKEIVELLTNGEFPNQLQAEPEFWLSPGPPE